MKNALLKHTILSLAIILLLPTLSCESEENKGAKKYPEIPIDQVDDKLKSRGRYLSAAILESFGHEEGALHLLEREDITPALHGAITKFTDQYDQAYQVINSSVGKIASRELFQVIDKGLIKTMRYKLVSESDFPPSSIELRLDISATHKLRNFYLYVVIDEEQQEPLNLLPTFTFKL